MVVCQRHNIRAHIQQIRGIFRLGTEGEFLVFRRSSTVAVGKFVIYHKNVCAAHHIQHFLRNAALNAPAALVHFYLDRIMVVEQNVPRKHNRRFIRACRRFCINILLPTQRLICKQCIVFPYGLCRLRTRQNTFRRLNIFHKIRQLAFQLHRYKLRASNSPDHAAAQNHASERNRQNQRNQKNMASMSFSSSFLDHSSSLFL